MTSDPLQLDAVGQADLVRRREVSPAELVDLAIARLERVNPRLNAVIHPALDRARELARSRDLPDGPFRGVPFLTKDIGGFAAGEPNHMGMKLLRDAAWRETQTTYFAARMQAAGLVSLGRTNTPELALLPTTEPEAFGPTRNPWDLSRSSGGSSGGASAAVAGGIVAAAHASDGGGSIRGPASMCGLVGLKGSRARTSFGPLLGERWSGLSSEFVLTRTVRDCAALLDVFAGAHPGDPYFALPPAGPYAQEPGRDPGRLRVGVMRRAPRGIELHPENLAAADRTAAALATLGHTVEESHPAALDDDEVVMAYVTIVACNVARTLALCGARVGRTPTREDVEPLTWALAERGGAATAPELLGAIDVAHRFGRALAGWWQDHDLLLTPTMALPPPLLGEISSTPDEPLRAFFRAAPYGVFTLSFNLSGQPAISLPVHWTPDGLPIGAQLVAAAGREDVLLRVAAQIEQALPWADRRAPELA